MKRLFTSARRNRLEFLLEVIPSKVGPARDTTTADLITRFYADGITPDWWKLEAQTAEGWQNAAAAIRANDPNCRGIVMLGLDAPEAEVTAAFSAAAAVPLVKGFAVGRTIFATAARDWLANEIDDAAATAQMAQTYARLCAAWDAARQKGQP